jgi:hypothetical protein
MSKIGNNKRSKEPKESLLHAETLNQIKEQSN